MTDSRQRISVGGKRQDEDATFLAQLTVALGDDYRIDKLIGQGGFGRVYSAADVRLGRSVAIKVIRPDLAGARAFVDRFRSEGTALAKFRHPGIVPIYDIREHEGLIYYVMPLIDGETLRTKIEKRGKLSPKETQRILIELCDCLAATHRGGIVHRDIKPDNVMLEGAALGKALLMDFGIAKNVRDSTESTAGVIQGTPTYMSPEQISGDSILDLRSDLYSVGVMAYHMLTGHPPFQGATTHAVLSGHVTDRPEPIRRTNPSVPRGLAEAVERCLEKDPENRFQSASELSDALQDVVFASDADVAEPAPANYAMPFFAGLAVECGVFAAFGRPVLALSSADLWYMTGVLGALAFTLSPFARAATGPLDSEMRDWFREKLRRRIKA
jgi:serine/threonine-protein kinase